VLRLVAHALTALALTVLAALAAIVPAALAVDPATPLTVGDRAFTVEEIVAEGKIGSGERTTDADLREAGARTLVATEWHAREAAARGLSVDPAVLTAAEAADARGASADEHARFLAGMGVTVEQRRKQLADGLLAEAIDDDVLRASGDDPVAFGRAYDALAQRHRAATVCLKAVVGDLEGACGNVAPKTGRCTQMGPERLCPYGSGRDRYWGLPGDLIRDFTDPGRLDHADGDTLMDGIDRVRRYLSAHGSPALRRCDTDPDDVAYVDCRRRSDAIAFAWAIARIHASAKRRWSAPATAGVVS
jgi:hypothetical protein